MLKISFPCDLNEVRAAVASVHEFLAQDGWNEEDLMSFDLVLVEACNNAVEHARGKNAPILLEALSDAKRVEFRIHDHTPGFDWPVKIELPPPDSESGRGLYLIHSLMDYAHYLRGQNKNLLILRRLRASGRN